MEATALEIHLLVACVLTSVVVCQNICMLQCVQDIYERSCGGGWCVRSYSTRGELEGLCSDECIEALHSQEFLDCLIEYDSSRPDWKQIQFTTIGKEVLDLCGKEYPLSAPAPAPEALPPAPEPEQEPPAPEPEEEPPAPEPEEEPPAPEPEEEPPAPEPEEEPPAPEPEEEPPAPEPEEEPPAPEPEEEPPAPEPEEEPPAPEPEEEPPAPEPEEEPPAPEPEVEAPAPEPELEPPAPAPEEDEDSLVTLQTPKSAKDFLRLTVVAVDSDGEKIDIFKI